MKKLLFALLTISAFQFCFAQTPAKAPNCFVIKGKIINSPQDFWEFAVTNFVSFETISVPLDKDGNFFKTVPLTHLQDLLIRSGNEAIFLFAVPGDTLDVSWDGKNFLSSFKVTSPQADRQQELKLELELSRKNLQSLMSFMMDFYEKNLSDSAKFEGIKKLFAAEVQTALRYPPTMYSKKIFCDIYFKYIGLLNQVELLSKYDLFFKYALPEGLMDSIYVATNLQGQVQHENLDNMVKNVQFLNLRDIHYTSLNEEWFYLSYNYREFIFDRVRLYKQPFNSFLNSLSKNNEEHNLIVRECQQGAAFLNLVPAIKDWFIAKSVMMGYQYSSFEEGEAAYKHFLPQIKTSLFRDTLKRFYENIQRLKPGSPAPAFTLKDVNGKNVSLSDFRGKVIYIDFWGVHCGPCRYDIENFAAKLHEKYKGKNVVFLNICVDVSEKVWKENLDKLHLDGVNLLAEGWVSNPVCKAYNVEGIPHYVLIDKKGNIIDNNADHIAAFVGENENQIDKLLK